MPLFSPLIRKLQRFLADTSITNSDQNKRSKILEPLLSKQEIYELKSRAQIQQTIPIQAPESAQQSMGDVNSIYRGGGLDYQESRKYQAGDDPRYMNWQLAARTGELYMKIFREEKQPSVFILIDRRESMRFGTKIRLKVTQAARIAAIIAFSAQQRAATISGIVLNSSPQWLGEAQGAHEIFRWVSDACSPCPPFYMLPAPAKIDLAQILRLLQSKLIPGSTLYLISDFFDVSEQNQSSLAYLALKHSVHAIQIFDPAELHLPKAGQLHLYPDSTSAALNPHLSTGINVDTESASTRKNYRKAALSHFRKTEQCFQSVGISYVKISTLLDNVENKIALL